MLPHVAMFDGWASQPLCLRRLTRTWRPRGSPHLPHCSPLNNHELRARIRHPARRHRRDRSLASRSTESLPALALPGGPAVMT